MPPRSNAFQRLVTLLHAALADDAKVTESAMLIDKVTGETREVDILISASTASYKVDIGIEVISWRRVADTPWIEKMIAKHADLPTDKLVLVSESGFSKPAKIKAAHNGIETLTIEDASNTDWSFIKNFESTGHFSVTTMDYEIKALCRLTDGTIEQIDVPKNASLNEPVGPKTLDEFVRMLIDREEFRETICSNLMGNHVHDFWFSYKQEQGLWHFDFWGKTGQIIELRVGLKVLETTTPVFMASGKFRTIPFVSGKSINGSTPLQFVLMRRPDGSINGYLESSDGIRSLHSKV
jgi:hypothetical protein